MSDKSRGEARNVPEKVSHLRKPPKRVWENIKKEINIQNRGGFRRQRGGKG